MYEEVRERKENLVKSSQKSDGKVSELESSSQHCVGKGISGSTIDSTMYM